MKSASEALNRSQNLDFELGTVISALITNQTNSTVEEKFHKKNSEADFQNFDAQMPKIVPKSSFFKNFNFSSLEIQKFRFRSPSNSMEKAVS